MARGLSEEDMERIAEFVQTPRYARRPDMLLPDTEDGGDRTDRKRPDEAAGE